MSRRALVASILALIGTSMAVLGMLLMSYIQSIDLVLSDSSAQRFVSFVLDRGLLGAEIRDFQYHDTDGFRYFTLHSGPTGGTLMLTSGPRSALAERTESGAVAKHSALLSCGLIEPFSEEPETQMEKLINGYSEAYPVNNAAITLALTSSLRAQLEGRVSRFKETIIVLPELLAAQANWVIARRFVPIICSDENARELMQNPLFLLIPGMAIATLGLFLLSRK